MNAVLKPHRADHVAQSNRVADALCQQATEGARGFELTATQRQLLFSLLRRAYLAGHGDASEKRKDI
jgi:hypothetical protein